MSEDKKPVENKEVDAKQLEERINVIAYNINTLKVLMDSISRVLSEYVEFNKHTEEFKKCLENKKNVDGKNDVRE